MIGLLALPFLVQGGLMAVDEFYFHRRRGLPTWEIWGHPLDTLTVILPLAFLLLCYPTQQNLLIYGGLAVFSCLFITKDELVHAEKCEPLEHWIHSVLFILHPIIFFCAGILKWELASVEFLNWQLGVLFAFLLYQLIYWRTPWAMK
jgi:hypothetical protein